MGGWALGIVSQKKFIKKSGMGLYGARTFECSSIKSIKGRPGFDTVG